jgi:acetolactate synthase-1/3 small subunit
MVLLRLDVYDRPGVLDRIAGLIRRNGWNISSINAGNYHNGTSQISIVLTDDRFDARKLGSQLYNMNFIHKYHVLNTENSVIRELAMIRLKTSDYNPADIPEARIIVQDENKTKLEITGTPWEIDRMLIPVQDKILDCIRSGPLAISEEGDDKL